MTFLEGDGLLCKINVSCFIKRTLFLHLHLRTYKIVTSLAIIRNQLWNFKSHQWWLNSELRGGTCIFCSLKVFWDPASAKRNMHFPKVKTLITSHDMTLSSRDSITPLSSKERRYQGMQNYIFWGHSNRASFSTVGRVLITGRPKSVLNEGSYNLKWKDK